MKKMRFSLANQDERLVRLLKKTDHKIAAVWSIACAERVLSYFEKLYPQDSRPRDAIDTCWAWIKTGVFKMTIIRAAALGSHAAARAVGADTPARSAARAAGHAVATAHVITHAIGAATYALQAIDRDLDIVDSELALAKEREWQYQYLVELQAAGHV